MSDGITITIKADSDAAAAKLSEFFGGVTEKLDALTRAGDYVRELGGKIAAAFTLGGIVEEFKHATETAEQFGEAVKKTGLSFPTLNALKTMGQNAHIAFDGLTLGLSLFNDKIFEAVRMGGDSARVFRDLHVEITNTRGQLLPTETVLKSVMDRFKEMPDGIQKSADAQELFGRSAREWIPLLNEGSAALEAMKATGGGITPEMAENAEQFNRAVVELKNSFEQVFLEASTKILPVLQDLVAWLKSLETSTGTEMKASDALVETFKVLATVAVTLKSGFVLLGEVIGDLAGYGFESMKSQVQAEIKVFLEWWDAVKKITAGLFDIAKAALGASSILKDLALGNYGAAHAEALKFLERTKADVTSIAGTLRDSTLNMWSTISGEFSKQWAMAVGQAKLSFNQFFNEGAALVSAWNSLWASRAKTPGAPATGGAKGAASGAGAAGAAAGAPIVSEEAKKLMEQVDKEYREATENKLALLDFERDQLIKKLTDEIHDQATLEAQKTRVMETYAAKRKEILLREQQERSSIALAAVEGQQKSIEKDPNLTDAQKREQLIPVLQAENRLISENIDLQRQRIDDPKLNDETKIAAQKELVKLTEQQVELQRQLTTTQSQGFGGTMSRGLTGLQNEWGSSFTDLEHNAAGGALDGIKKGVDGVGTAIMGALEHTRTWGQVFAQVGTNIVASLINIVVQWVASMTIIAALKSIFQVKDSTDAAESASAWAPAAIAASIASYGAAAAVGTSAYLAALMSGTAITAGVSAVAGHATGGLIQGPGTGTSDSILARLSHGEYVMPAARVAQYGTDFFEQIRQGAVAVHNLGNAGSRLITTPITSAGGASGSDDDGSTGAGGSRGGGNGGVTVQGHRMTIIQPRSRQEMLDAMASAEGEKIVVGHAKKNRLQIGVGT